MDNIKSAEKKLNWYKKRVDVPFWAYLLSSFLIWCVVGMISLAFDSTIDIIQTTHGQMINQVLFYGISGIAFAFIMRSFFSFQHDRLANKIEKNS